MAYFRKRLTNTLMPQDLIRLGDGVNRANGPFDMKKSEAYTSLNLCSENYPALSVRQGRDTPYTDVTGPINAVGIRDNSEVHIQDGTVWKKWNGSSWDTLATGLANTKSRIFDYVRETDRLTILVNGTNRKYYDGTSVYDLWDKFESTAADWDWADPVIINNKMYVRIVSETKSLRNAIGIYDIIEDEWSTGAENDDIDSGNDTCAIPGWRYPVAYGSYIFVSVLTADDPMTCQFMRYDVAANSWSEMASPPELSTESYIYGMCASQDGIIYASYYPPGMAEPTELMKYNIAENEWDYYDALDVAERAWYGGIAVTSSDTTRVYANDDITVTSNNTTKIYANGILNGNRVIVFNATRGVEEWEDTGTKPANGGTGWKFIFALGTKLYATDSSNDLLVYDTVTRTWDETCENSIDEGVLYVTDYDNIILSKGDSNEVLWYFISLDVFGDDDTFEAPETNLYTADEYRLFALDDSQLRCTDIAVPTDWIYGDSDTITITSMVGDGTAITWYKNMVICWSDQSMHILMGDDTENFKWMEVIKDGCLSARGHTINEGVLYFADYGAVKSFTGGVTREISQKVRDYLEDINTTYKSLVCMGSDGKYVYISFPYQTSTTNNYTLVYDTRHDTWYVWNKGFTEFVKMGEYLYASDSTSVWRLNYGTADDGVAISWSFETGAWNEGALRQVKAISDLYVLADLPATSSLTISYSTTVDGNDWATLYTFTGSSTEQNTRVQVPTSALQPINWYRLKFAGSGPCTIFYLEPHIRIKSR